MLLSSVIVMLILRADVWLMGVFLDQSQIGVYSAAIRFTLPLTIVLGAINTALWPRASTSIRVQDTLALLRKTFRLTLLVAMVGLPYAIGAPLLAPWLFGSRYAGSVLLGQLLCLRYLFSMFTCPIGIVGYNFGLVRVYWLVNLLQLIAVVVINVLLLPIYGPIGSAVALFTNDAFGFVVIGTLIWRKMAQMKVGTSNG